MTGSSPATGSKRPIHDEPPFPYGRFSGRPILWGVEKRRMIIVGIPSFFVEIVRGKEVIEVGYYDTALICKNGHVVNENFHSAPEFNVNYCAKCGKETIFQCPTCKKEIRGEYHVEGVVSLSVTRMTAPNYCYNCGSPYPWTEVKLKALDELIDLMDELSEEEKETFKESGRDISTDNPKTELGVFKIKKLVRKIGEGAWNAARDILVQIASETAIKAMEKQGML